MGAANYATDYAKRFTRDKIKENLKKGMKLPIPNISELLLVIRLVYLDKNVGNNVKSFVKSIRSNPIFEAAHEKRAIHSHGNIVTVGR